MSFGLLGALEEQSTCTYVEMLYIEFVHTQSVHTYVHNSLPVVGLETARSRQLGEAPAAV